MQEGVGIEMDGAGGWVVGRINAVYGGGARCRGGRCRGRMQEEGKDGGGGGGNAVYGGVSGIWG